MFFIKITKALSLKNNNKYEIIYRTSIKTNTKKQNRNVEVKKKKSLVWYKSLSTMQIF